MEPGGNTANMANSHTAFEQQVPLANDALWTGPKSGPMFPLRSFFSGGRQHHCFDIEHFAPHHIINGHNLLANDPLVYDKDEITELVHLPGYQFTPWAFAHGSGSSMWMDECPKKPTGTHCSQTSHFSFLSHTLFNDALCPVRR